MKNRSIVYVDGFNLFYGALKGSAHKWLNLERYFRMVRPDDDLQVIRYFSAPVMRPLETHENQQAYLQALDTLECVEVILGRFKKKSVRCRVDACGHSGNRSFQHFEEKRTDVSIAITMVDDAYQDLADRFIVVSGDSDLVPAIALVKKRFPEKTVIVYVPARDPTRGAAVEIRSTADKARSLPLAPLPKAQFPPEISDGHGGTIHKPASW